MALIGKAWGTTEVLLATPMIEVHRLFVEPRKRCSMHCHKMKANAFYVRTGTLIVEVEKSAYALVDRTILGPGDLTTVKPGEYHRFLTEDEAVEAIEIYYPEALSEDIVRRDVGGELMVAMTSRVEEAFIPDGFALAGVVDHSNVGFTRPAPSQPFRKG